MLNTKLLTTVLDTEVRDFRQLDNYIYYNSTTWVNADYSTAFGEFEDRINVDTLVRLCKAWALGKGFTIVQYNTWGNTVKCLLYPSDKVFVDEYLTRIKEDTEADAVFKAVKYIIENK